MIVQFIKLILILFNKIRKRLNIIGNNINDAIC